MSEFLTLLEGQFSNKKQAQSHPTRYAHIWITYKSMGGTRFYGEQAYNYLRNRPYLQYVIDINEDGDEVRTKNYEIRKQDEQRFLQGVNLELLTDDLLTYREGCDLIFKKTGDQRYEGGTDPDCQCFIDWNGKNTYLRNSIILNHEGLDVMDEGLDPITHQKIRGYNYGHHSFKRP